MSTRRHRAASKRKGRSHRIRIPPLRRRGEQRRVNLDYLLHNILNTNAEIPNDYRAATVTLKDGRVLSGVIGAQDATVVTTKEMVTVPRADIATLTQSDVSMMPEGLLEPLSDQEVRDLVAYLRGARQVPAPRSAP